MNKLRVDIPNKAQQYQILIEEGLLEQPNRWLPANVFQCVIISDHIVDNYYGDRLSNALKQLGINPLRLTFEAGEASKINETKLMLESQMLEHAFGRDSLILALGGGVVGDLAGFIAATYMRGIDFIQIPTSLLAMVDSSIGGKVGIDNQHGKNLIGAFHQPKMVVSDVSCLETLPKIHRLYGLIEAVKMFITFDKPNFEWASAQDINALLTDKTLLLHLIRHAASHKANIFMRDPEERMGLRASFNFGHTIGHALEKVSAYQLPHAEAVALGILVEIQISKLMNILSSDDCLLIENFFLRIGTDVQRLENYEVDEVIAKTQIDKKIKKGQVHYLLLKKIGEVFCHEGEYTHLVE